jgi:CheY-like chemotaxis protein
VVDDDEGNLQMTAQVLRLHGASVMISRDAASAQATARDWDPDLLVLDIGMPEIDGYQLLGLLRAAVGRQVPAIALSGFASREDIQRSWQAGFQAHVAKPFDPGGFCHVVAQHAPRGAA